MSDKTETALDVLVKWAKDVIPVLMKELPPNDDLTPVMLAKAGDGTGVVYPLREFFRSDESKQQLYMGLAQVFVDIKPEAALLVNCAWMREAPAEEIDSHGLGKVSEHPDRREGVVLAGYDGKTFIMHTCPIIRSPDKPPELGEWDDTPVEGKPTGRIARALAMAFDAAAMYNRIQQDVTRN